MSRRSFIFAVVPILGLGAATTLLIGRSAGLRSELDMLKDEVAVLHARLEALERRPAPDPRSFSVMAAPLVTAPSSIAPSVAAPASWLPTALAAPEVREQFRQVVATEMAEERSRDKAQKESTRLDREREKREQVAADLGLTADEAARLDKSVTDTVAARRWIEGLVKSGQREPRELAGEVAVLRERTDRELRQLLGDARYAQFLEMTADDKHGLAGGPSWARIAPPSARGADGGR